MSTDGRGALDRESHNYGGIARGGEVDVPARYVRTAIILQRKEIHFTRHHGLRGHWGQLESGMGSVFRQREERGRENELEGVGGGARLRCSGSDSELIYIIHKQASKCGEETIDRRPITIS